jgi:GNAT superfamily N-acetyltransferase
VELLVRSALADDLPRMMAIKHDAGVAAWGHILPPAVVEVLPFLDRWVAAIDAPDPRIHVLIVEAGSAPVGFAITRPSGDADAGAETGELDAFFVDPTSWGVGAGRALLGAAMRALRAAGFRDATLWTAAENHRPRRIYEIAGWRTDGTDRQRAFEGVEFVEVRYRIAVSSSS